MIVAVGLLVAALVVGFVAPRWLDRLAAPRRHPRVALAAWLASQVAFVGALAAIPMALWARPGDRWQLVPAATLDCVRGLRERGPVPWPSVLEAGLCLVALAATVRVAVVVVRRLRRHRRVTEAHASALRRVGRTDPADGDVYHLQGHEFAAYSIGGRSPAIVLGAAVADLPSSTRAAVLAHERAHVRGRHHALVAWAEALAAALPAVPLARAGAVWIRVLVELTADRHAAATCGSGAVCAALERWSGTPGAGAPASASHLEDRVAWLSGVRAPRRGTPVLHYPLAVTVSVLPVLAAVPIVVTAFALYCATVGA